MLSFQKRVLLPLLGCALFLSQIAKGDNEDPFDCKIEKAAFSSETEDHVSDCNRKALSELANAGLHTLSYAQAREQMFQFVDVYTADEGPRVVDSVYTSSRFEVGASGIPHNGVNTEHTWPQSLLKLSPRYAEARADIHHLFPVDERENSRRSNHPFAECPGEPEPTEKPGELCAAGYEVPEWHKGVVARAMFYVAVTYGLSLSENEEQVLRQWNANHAVTERERVRGDRIFSVQHNRNPFVEHPEWVELVADF